MQEWELGVLLASKSGDFTEDGEALKSAILREDPEGLPSGPLCIVLVEYTAKKKERIDMPEESFWLFPLMRGHGGAWGLTCTPCGHCAGTWMLLPQEQHSYPYTVPSGWKADKQTC